MIKKATMKCLWATFFLACLLICDAGMIRLHGQSSTGTIQGTVTDPSGQAMQGANVAVVTESGVVQRLVTSGDGKFVATGLPADTYTVEISATGFSTQIHHQVVVAAGATVSLPVNLTVASVSEEVTVEAEGDTSLAAQLAPVKSVLDAGSARTEITAVQRNSSRSAHAVSAGTGARNSSSGSASRSRFTNTIGPHVPTCTSMSG